MDCELEILWAGSFPVLGIFITSSYHTSRSSCALLTHTLDSTIGAVNAGLSNQTSKAALAQGPAGNIDPTHALILTDNGAQLNDGWHAMCKKPSLPILCIHCMGDAILVVEV